MKKAPLLIGTALAIVMACGCASTDNASTTPAGTSSEGTAPAGKPGMDGSKMKGVGADQIGLAPGAQNPDAQTGSKLGGN